jgi:hypothetical protein
MWLCKRNITQPGDFPLTDTWSYLKAANVELVPTSATWVMTDWQTDVPQNGGNNFNVLAEDTASDGLREEGANFFVVVKKILPGAQAVAKCSGPWPGR